MTVRCHTDTLDGTCGVGLVFSYCTIKHSSYDYRIDANRSNLLEDAGIGYAVAGFVNTTVCKDMYDIIKRRYKIVFQSPVKKNNNSGNDFFFIVFTKKD